MDLLQPLAAVGLVMALLAGALVLLKKRGVASFHGGTRRLEPVERLALGPQHTLHLVKVDGRLMLIAASPTALQILSETEVAK